MAGQGTTTINFGTFPGSPDAQVTITGQTGITGTSLVEAWVFPTATADHSVDEHWADPPEVMAGNIVAGTGFTIYGVAKTREGSGIQRERSNNNSNPYGLWTVAWVWN